MKKLTKGKL